MPDDKTPYSAIHDDPIQDDAVSHNPMHREKRNVYILANEPLYQLRPIFGLKLITSLPVKTSLLMNFAAKLMNIGTNASACRLLFAISVF